MSAFITLVYAFVVYLFCLATLMYAIGFSAAIPGLKTIDSGVTGDVWAALLVDVALLAVFAVQHSVMARRGFKQWWTQFVPKPVERSTYVLAASLAVALLIWQWRPIPGVVWSVDNEIGRNLLIGVAVVGWTMLLFATFLINHFERFGLQQAYHHWRGRLAEESAFRTPALYKVVRHPIYLGFILGFWATPHMSVGHLLFAVATTAYIFIGIFFEERDLIARFGNEYRRYRQRVPMLFPSLTGVDRSKAEGPSQSRVR